MKLLVSIYLFFTIFVYAMPQQIESFIKKSTIPSKNIGIYIKEVGTHGKVLVNHYANTPRVPASIIKVLSTYSSVLKFGFDYKFTTKFYMKGYLRHGILHGDLIVKALGDPTIHTDDLDDIVKHIHSLGIKKIAGNIVIDRSYFRVGSKNNSGFDENLYSPYNAMPDAMMYNERISTISLTPKDNKVIKKGADASYKVVNHLQRVNQACRGRYSWAGVSIKKNSAIPKVVLQGKISKKCGRQNISKVITKPYLSFYYALKDKLEQEGIKVRGKMRLRKVPHHAKLLFVHKSDNLEKIISTTAKKSNNLYARHLLLNLGAAVYGAPATVLKGRRAIKSILKKHGMHLKGLRIDNGCGLSREAKLPAKVLVDVLDDAYKRYGQRWMNTLSIAGVDGTIKRRFQGSVVQNRAWMKTGTLKRTKNIGGYVKSKSGTLYEVVIMVQSHRGNWRAAQLQNEIITWLVKYRD